METTPLATETYKSPRKIEEDARILGHQVFEVFMSRVDSGNEEAPAVYQALSEADAQGLEYIGTYLKHSPYADLADIWPPAVQIMVHPSMLDSQLVKSTTAA